MNSKIFNRSEIPILDINTLTMILQMCDIANLSFESPFPDESLLIDYLAEKDLNRQVKIRNGKGIVEIVLA